MPRKTEEVSDLYTARTGFNEAAARCRGKHTEYLAGRLLAGIASMRPRPDAAENP